MAAVKTKIKKEINGVREEMRNKTVSYIVTAFGLVAGLAWNDAVKALIEYFFPTNKHTVQAKFTYAIFISILVVVVSVYLSRLVKSEKEKSGQKASEN